MHLHLISHDEVFIIDLAQVLYFQADDHYAHVYYTSGTHFMVPYGLSRIEDMLEAVAHKQDTSCFRRMGRKYIVNTCHVFRVNTVKELLFLSDRQGNTTSLHIPKNLLRDFINDIKDTSTESFTK